MAVEDPGPAPDPVTVPAPPEAGERLAFHQLHRAGARGWWRPVVGVLLLFVIGILAVPVLVQLATVLWLVANGTEDPIDEYARLLDLSDPTPFGLAYLNIVLAALIPLVLVLTRVLHGLRPGTATSILPRMRWGYFAVCFGVSFLALFVTVLVSALLPSQPAGSVSTELNDFTSQTQQFALVVLFLTPLQAAGEEYAFRGYLTQVFGGRFPTYVAVLAPAVLFALAHGAQDPPIFVDRLAFGIMAGILVVRTGGLEAAIAMHVLNNWLAFTLALAFGDMGSALNPSGGTWWSLPVTLTQSLVYLGLALLAARGMGLDRTADPAVLVPRRRRV